MINFVFFTPFLWLLSSCCTNALQLMLLSSSVNCSFPHWLIVVYLMFPGCHFAEAPANTASTVAFQWVDITAKWLLIFIYRLLCSIAVAVISLHCCIAAAEWSLLIVFCHLLIVTFYVHHHWLCWHHCLLSQLPPLLTVLAPLPNPLLFLPSSSPLDDCCFFKWHILFIAAVTAHYACTVAKATAISTTVVTTGWLLLQCYFNEKILMVVTVAITAHCTITTGTAISYADVAASWLFLF